MIKQIAIVVLFIAVSNAQISNNGPVDSTGVLETVWCIVSSNPWECARGQAGRVLNNWDSIFNEKWNDFLSEADNVNAARASNDLKSNEKPSEIMKVIQEELAKITDEVSDGVDNFVSRSSSPAKVMTKSSTDDDELTLYEEFEKTGYSEGRVLNKNVNDLQKKKQNGFGHYNDYNENYYAINKGGYGGYGGKGKKHKKKKLHKKGMMKLFLIGAVVKAKIEMLLKILSFKLQLKFFVIALIGLVINIARFWIDIKNKGQKVVYYEHAQHNHHYDQEEEHGWGGGSSGGYWKRQGQADQTEQQSDYAQRLAYQKH